MDLLTKLVGMVDKMAVVQQAAKYSGVPRPGYDGQWRRVCYTCKKTGHLKRDCPSTSGIWSTRRAKSGKQDSFKKAVGELPMKIAGVEVPAIVDTGSQVTIGPLSFFHSHLQGQLNF